MNDYVKNMHTSTGLLNKLGNPSLTTPVEQMVEENKSSNHDALIDIEECVRELRVYQRVLYSGLQN